MDVDLSDEELAENMKEREKAMKRDWTLQNYTDYLRADVAGMAIERTTKNGKFVWYDMCCGKFMAAQDLVRALLGVNDLSTISRISARGVDILAEPGDKEILPGVIISRGNVVNYPIQEGVDLITCHAGLEYVQKYTGKAYDAVAHWYNSLPIGGIIAFDVPISMARELEHNIYRHLKNPADVRLISLHAGKFYSFKIEK